MHIVLVSCQLALSAVLLIAAVGKLTYPRQFLTAIRVSGIPRPLIYPIAILAVIFELELASSLIFSTAWSLPVSFAGTFLLLGAFTGWQVLVYQRKLHVQCGCFGASHAHVNKKSILRNFIFMGISVTGFFVALVTPGMPLILSGWIIAVDTIMAIGTLLLFLKHLSPGRQVNLTSGNKEGAEEGTNLLTARPN